MRIILFTRAFSPSIGGIERIADILANEFSAYGHQVVVVTDTPSNQAVENYSSFSIIRTNTLRGRFYAFKDSDVILFFNLSLVGLVPALLSRKPIIFSHHGIYVGKNFFANILELIKRNLTNFFPNISVSKFVAKHIPGESVVIRNAYDVKLFDRNNNVIKSGDFVFCGRLVPEKGVILCVEAFKLVLNYYPSASLTIIGDGPEMAVVKNFVLNNQMNNHVSILGGLSGTPLVAEMQRHSCLLVPSIWQEPFGIVALEGFASCDTVIASKTGGLPEVLDGLGMVVEPNAKALSMAMIAVLKSKNEGNALPGQPNEIIRFNYLSRHTPGVIAKHYLEFIEENI